MGGGAAFVGTNGNGASHARAASNGEDFSDFQGSGTAAGVGGAKAGGGGGESAAAMPMGATNGGVTNPKWKDVSALVDLGGLSSNTDKKVGVVAVGCSSRGLVSVGERDRSGSRGDGASPAEVHV